MFTVAALSTVLSTAALDKHPQSKERGITLDLGFSAFSVSMCDTLVGVSLGWRLLVWFVSSVGVFAGAFAFASFVASL